MKKILVFLFFISLFLSCTNTEEGYKGMIEYEKTYMNRLETIVVVFPDSTGNITIRKYENIHKKDISIKENNAVTFPDTVGHYITFINCPIMILNSDYNEQ